MNQLDQDCLIFLILLFSYIKSITQIELFGVFSESAVNPIIISSTIFVKILALYERSESADNVLDMGVFLQSLVMGFRVRQDEVLVEAANMTFERERVE